MSSNTTFDSWLAALPAETCTSADLQLPPYIEKNLRSMSIDDACADVTLTCEGRSFKCHRTVLAMFSSVFQSMLGTKAAAEFKFEGYNFDLLEKAVCFLYGHELIITAEDVTPLLRFANRYDVTPLREACGKMLMKHVKPSVAMTVWSKFLKYDSAPLFYAKAQKYCAQVFNDAYGKEVEFTRGYFEADKNMIIDLLSDAELNVATENDVFDAIVDWMMHKENDRAVHAQEILKKCIRSDMMSSQDAYRKLQRISASECNYTLKAAFFDLCFELAAPDIQQRCLPVRSNTQELATLSCCVFAGNKLAVVSYSRHGGSLVAVGHPEVCESTCDGDIHATYIFENELYIQKEIVENRQASVLRKNIPVSLHHVFNRFGTVGSHAMLEEELLKPITEDVHAVSAALLHTKASGALVAIEQDEDDVVVRQLVTNAPGLEVFKEWSTLSRPITLFPLFQDICSYHLMTSYNNDLVVFNPKDKAAYVFDISDGTHKCTIPLTFIGKRQYCGVSAIANKRNISCVITKTVVCVIRLDRLLHGSSDVTSSTVAKLQQKEAMTRSCAGDDATDNSDDGTDYTHDRNKTRILTRVRAPVATKGKELTSAVIYGKHLYVAESPVTNEELVLHATDFNDLLQLGKNGCPRWEKHVIALHQSTWSHIDARKAKVGLFTTTLENPSFVSE